MNVLISTLLISNLIIVLGSAIVIAREVRNLKKAAEEVLTVTEMNSHDICRAKVTILEKIEDSRETILDNNTDNKEFFKKCIVEEVPKTVFKFAFPPAPWRKH